VDPVLNLQHQRTVAADILTAIDSMPAEPDDRAERNELLATLAGELAEQVQALDEWRLKDGFDPWRAEHRTKGEQVPSGERVKRFEVVDKHGNVIPLDADDEGTIEQELLDELDDLDVGTDITVRRVS
jgi:biotin-(acetyl-CoA carboxylase) ligase